MREGAACEAVSSEASVGGLPAVFAGYADWSGLGGGKRPGDLFADAGDVKVTDTWAHTDAGAAGGRGAAGGIEHAGASIIMKYVEIDPAYGRC